MQRTHTERTARRPVKRIIKWATKSYQGRLGEYIGVALDQERTAQGDGGVDGQSEVVGGDVLVGAFEAHGRWGWTDKSPV